MAASGTTKASGRPAGPAPIKGGSFKTMGLFSGLQRGIQRKGFMNPTPIQRRAIPVLLGGTDVVAMARTGSGKTAAFAVPIVQRLRLHSAKVGCRALVLAPTRELALQSTQIIQQLAKFTDLRTVCVVGGDSLDEQFSMLAANPDIIVATPGRLVHLCLEAKLSILRTVEMFVLDEADRLFEMGFAAQVAQIIDLMNNSDLTEIISHGAKPDAAPEFNRVNRQCALFSATLPKQVADFARIGLVRPEIIRLDADGKLSPDLKTMFFHVKSEFKEAALVHILQNLASVSSFSFADQAMVFVATRHHAEYLGELAKRALNMRAAAVYGTMDQEARVALLDDFRHKRLDVLFVTDVAARGLDIPLLDVVINYDFPGKAKLFVHRVGRVARNGRPGVAISLVSPDELPYYVDLKLFLGDSSVTAIGSVPQALLDEQMDHIRKKKALCSGMNFEDLRKVMINASKLYCSTRSPASPESYDRAKAFIMPMHPAFEACGFAMGPSVDILSAIHSYKRHQNLLKIPEITPKNGHAKSADRSVEKLQKETYFLSYKPSNAASTLVDKAFALEDSVMDLKGDDSAILRKRAAVKAQNRKSTIKRDDKANFYEKWKRKNQASIQAAGSTESKHASDILKRQQDKRRHTETYLNRRHQQKRKPKRK